MKSGVFLLRSNYPWYWHECPSHLDPGHSWRSLCRSLISPSSDLWLRDQHCPLWNIIKQLEIKLDLKYKLLHRKYSLYWKVDILPDFQFFSVFVHEDLQWGLYMTIYLNKKYPVQPSLSFRWPATWKLEPGNCCCISVAWWIIYYPSYWIIESPTGAGNKKTISPALMKHWLLVPGDAGRKLSLAESSINIRISQARNENPTTLHPANCLSWLFSFENVLQNEI